LSVSLPPLPDRSLLADLCREAGARERLEPQLIERDFYLTTLLCALGQRSGDALLLRGGTLLSKVDLGFFRMSRTVLCARCPRSARGEGARRLHALAVSSPAGPLPDYASPFASYCGGTCRLDGRLHGSEIEGADIATGEQILP
jgi:hypothetical protein